MISRTAIGSSTPRISSRAKNRSFFETYPDEYDALTDAAAREKPHGREIAAIIEKFRPTSVLDAGCATGLTSRLFARQGIRTVGIDRVKPMLDIARSNSLFDKPLLSYNYGHFEKLPKGMTGKFDLVVCLANAIGGVGTMANLKRTLANFYRVLVPGGHLVVQMLNFGAIADGKIMPVRATRRGGIIYQRFSEHRAGHLYLYVSRLDTAAKPPKFEIFRHEMDNFSPLEVTGAMRRAGFKKLERWGDLLLSKRFTRSSRDLVITAPRSA